MIPKALGRDASANDVERLRQRLSIEGDLPQDGWDDALTDAVTRFQRRAGLAWIYLDAWGSADGTVHYRPDVYGLDGAADGHQTRR
jgi:murein L,D-transpeptidase YcbB/YkuD